MLAITLALAGYFYNSVQQFEYDVKRTAVAHSVLSAYRTVSTQTRQMLNLMEESVEQGRNSDLPLWHNTISALRSGLDEVRKARDEESALIGDDADRVESEVLDKLDDLVEGFIGSGESIMIALDAQRFEDAGAALQRLNREGTVDVFNFLMGETVAAQAWLVDDANINSVSRAQQITGVLPLFMLMLAGFTALIAGFFSHSLTRSVSFLHDGARAFSTGDFNHRIPHLQEKEFRRLADAFNIMARELADHRTRLRDSNIRLEAMVEERTRALTISNEMLAHADANRRRLLADISHQFRTPLTVIRGEAEIALRGDTKTTKQYQESLNRIVDQSDQTARLVDDLLFIARAVAGEPSLDVRPVSLSSLLRPLCQEFRPQAEQNEIRIVQSFKDDTAVVMGDSGRLHQVFSILLNNAIRHSTQGGKVTVGLGRRQEEIIVTVSDTGIGLTSEEAQKAFLHSFHPTQSQDPKRGTGLGLPVAKAIVEAHNGSITLEGKPGEGAVASVVLPVEDRLKAVA